MHKFRERILLLLGDVISLNLAIFVVYWFRFRSHLAPAEIELSPISYLVPALWTTQLSITEFCFGWPGSMISRDFSITRSISG